MSITKLINVVGLSIGFVGALLVFFNTPEANYNTYLYQHDEQAVLVKKASRTNKLARLGMLFIAIGFVLQLIGLVISD